jgi:hypothetical protein
LTISKSQLDKFKKAAREAKADMDEKAFDQAIGAVAKSKPKSLPPLKKTKKVYQPDEQSDG